MNSKAIILILNIYFMAQIVVIEEEKINTLLNKIEQIYATLVENSSGNNLNEINGFVSESDACKLIGKSKTWLWRKRTEDMLPFKKLGAKIFYAKADLFNLLEDVA